MATDFPLVDIPAHLIEVVGKPEKGTRIFRQKGTDEECGLWFDLISQIGDGRFVSPGGVSMFAGGSRAAVHKRLKAGTLTAFCFHVETYVQGWFGKTKRTVHRSPYMYIPVVECKAWGEHMRQRALKMMSEGKVVARTVAQRRALLQEEDVRPDWVGKFLDKDFKLSELDEARKNEGWRTAQSIRAHREKLEMAAPDPDDKLTEDQIRAILNRRVGEDKKMKRAFEELLKRQQEEREQSDEL